MYGLETADVEIDSLQGVGIFGWVTYKLLQLNDSFPACKAIRNAQLSDCQCSGITYLISFAVYFICLSLSIKAYKLRTKHRDSCLKSNSSPPFNTR